MSIEKIVAPFLLEASGLQSGVDSKLSEYMREIGRRGGRSRSDKKTASSRETIKKAIAARLKRDRHEIRIRRNNG